MFKNIIIMEPFKNKLKLENIFEGDEAVKATQLLLKICKENDLHFIAYGLSKLQLKIVYKEVEYSGE